MMLSVSHTWCWRRIFLHRCMHCQIPFPRLGQLLSHLSRHGTGRPYTCVECRKVFNSSAVHRLHRCVFHGEKRPVMFDGRKRTAEAQVLADPRKKVRNIGNIQHRMPAAQKCGVQIPVPASPAIGRMTKIVRKAVKIKLNKAGTYSCPCCSKTFPLIFQLKDHVKTHSSNRPHNCPKCHKCYKKNAHLEEHVRTVHEGSRPYRCRDIFVLQKYI